MDPATWSLLSNYDVENADFMYYVEDIDGNHCNDFNDDFNEFQTAPDKSMFFHAQEYCWEQGNLRILLGAG